MTTVKIDDLATFQDTVKTMTSFMIVVHLKTGVEVLSSPMPKEILDSVRINVHEFLNNETDTFVVWNQRELLITECPFYNVSHITFKLL